MPPYGVPYFRARIGARRDDRKYPLMLSTYRRIFELLDRGERRSLGWLLVLVVVMGLTDMAGVASILPFLAVVSDPGLAHSNPYLVLLYDASGVKSDQSFLIVLGLGVLVVVAVGTCVKVVTQYMLSRFSHLRNHTISSRLLARYLHQPYVWFLNHHSANLGATVLGEVDKLVGGSMIPAMRILANAVSMAFLIALLVAVNPTVALASAVFLGGAYGLIFVFVRKKLTVLGRQRIAANESRHRMAAEAFGGMKELKLLDLAEQYIARFQEPSYQQATSSSASQIIGEIPKYLLEAIAFGGMVVLILALLILGDGSLAGILPLMGVFAFATLKIFPATQQVYNSLTLMRFSEPILAKVHADMAGQSRTHERPDSRAAVRPLPLRTRLDLIDVQFSYPQASRTALVGLSLSIAAKTTVGIVGGTGAGKTTAVDLILGLLDPSSGRIEVDGVPLSPATMRSWQKTLGYVPQQIYLADDSVSANIALGIPPELRDQVAVERAARLAELHDFVIRDLPQGYDTYVGERGVRLSGGQRQRIGIARALYHNPEVLILDEATSALDTLTERAVMHAVNNLSHARTIIIIAHRLSTVRACDTIFLLEHGSLIAQGNYDALVAGNDTFRRMAV